MIRSVSAAIYAASFLFVSLRNSAVAGATSEQATEKHTHNPECPPAFTSRAQDRKTVHSALRLRGKTDIKRLSSRPSKSLGIGDCAAEALAFDAEPRERAREPYLSFGCQPDESCPPVLGGGDAWDEPGLFRARDELRDRALRELEPIREAANGCLLASVRRALDHQQEQRCGVSPLLLAACSAWRRNDRKAERNAATSIAAAVLTRSLRGFTVTRRGR